MDYITEARMEYSEPLTFLIGKYVASLVRTLSDRCEGEVFERKAASKSIIDW